MSKSSRRFAAMIMLLSLCLAFGRLQPHAFDAARERIMRNAVKRHLAEGDFDEVNKLIEEVVVQIPDTSLQVSSFSVDIMNFECKNFYVSDVVLEAEKESNQKVTMAVDLKGFNFACTFDYKYRYLWVSGKGDSVIESFNNDFSFVYAIHSPDLDEEMPTGSSLESCSSDVEIDNIKLYGGLSRYSSIAVPALKLSLEQLINPALCAVIGDEDETPLSPLLVSTSEMLEPYLGQASSDPLAAENALSVPTGVELLNFMDNDGPYASLIVLLQEAIEANLGALVDHPDGINQELALNAMIRTYMLDSNGGFTLNLDSLGDVQNSLSWGNNSVTVETIEVYGLDTITLLDPLKVIGNYTLQSRLQFGELKFVADISMEVSPSIPDNSLIYAPAGSMDYAESVKITTSMENVTAMISLLLAVDENTLGDLMIGSLMHSRQILPCLMSIGYDVQFSQLILDLDDIEEPTVEGITSPGIEHVVTEVVEALFLIYEGPLLKALPVFCDTTVKEMLNDMVDGTTVPLLASNSCPQPQVTSETALVDFRDLLLAPSQSLIYGGSGMSPYGDLFPTFMTFLRKYLSGSADGNFILNQYIPEKLEFPGFLFSQEADVAGMALAIEAHDASIENLNSIGQPLSLLNPLMGEPYILRNEGAIGIGKTLRGTIILDVVLSDSSAGTRRLPGRDKSTSGGKKKPDESENSKIRNVETDAPTLSPNKNLNEIDSPTLSPTLNADEPTASPSASSRTKDVSNIDYERTTTPESSTEEPTGAPTQTPTITPTTQAPSTGRPTDTPTQTPTDAPTETPTSPPTQPPTTDTPTQSPTGEPTEIPTSSPTQAPTSGPTNDPTQSPTETPSARPTEIPTEQPTDVPTEPLPTPHDLFSFTFEIDEGSGLIDSLSKIVEQRLLEMPLSHSLDSNCWVATIATPELDENGIRVPGTEPSVSIEKLMFDFTDLRYNLTCISCNTPMGLSLEQTFSSPDSTDMMIPMVQDLINGVLESDVLLYMVEDYISAAAPQCPLVYGENSSDTSASGSRRHLSNVRFDRKEPVLARHLAVDNEVDLKETNTRIRMGPIFLIGGSLFVALLITGLVVRGGNLPSMHIGSKEGMHASVHQENKDTSERHGLYHSQDIA